jgi:hypothetical protein
MSLPMNSRIGVWCGLLVLLTAAGWAVVVQPRMDPFQTANAAGPHNKSMDLGGYQHVLYVSSMGKGDGERDHPLNQLDAALRKIDDAGPANRYAILVATGRYRVVDLQMKPFVDLFGGFSAADWSRDIFGNQTVLNAQKKGRVLLGASQARLDGFTITGGRVRGHGGAILCEDTSPILTNNVFQDNGTLEPTGYHHGREHQLGHCGGAIACMFKAGPFIANNIFTGNTTEIGDGGAIWCFESNQQIVIADNAFIANRGGVGDPNSKTRASNGGAIAMTQGACPFILRNVIVHNLVNDNSDAGGIYCEYRAHPLVRGNWIVGNRCYDDGGGMYVMQNSDPIIDGNTFAGGWSFGGGVGGLRLSKEGRAHIWNNIFAFNVNGGIDSVGSHMILVNNNFISNTGGAVCLDNPPDYFQPDIVRNNIFWQNGRALVIRRNDTGVPPIVTHNNIANEDVTGGEIGEGNFNADPGFVNDGRNWRAENLIYDPRRFMTRIVLATPLQNDSLPLAGRVLKAGKKWSIIAGAESGERPILLAWGDLTTGPEGTGENPVTELITIPSYHLTAESPCIGKGTKENAPDHDRDGDVRPDDAGMDVGADEANKH